MNASVQHVETLLRQLQMEQGSFEDACTEHETRLELALQFRAYERESTEVKEENAFLRIGDRVGGCYAVCRNRLFVLISWSVVARKLNMLLDSRIWLVTLHAFSPNPVVVYPQSLTKAKAFCRNLWNSSKPCCVLCQLFGAPTRGVVSSLTPTFESLLSLLLRNLRHTSVESDNNTISDCRCRTLCCALLGGQKKTLKVYEGKQTVFVCLHPPVVKSKANFVNAQLQRFFLRFHFIFRLWPLVIQD